MSENHSGKRVLIKYGGNAMVNDQLKKEIIENICRLREDNNDVVLVHGGGPFIKEMLEMARVDSEFIDGHRKTSLEAVKYVEMALKGSVNGNLVNLINRTGHKAVGLSGKDGNIVMARKRKHFQYEGEKRKEIDLGQVGDVALINTSLIDLLLANQYIPVITSLASDPSGLDYNINADMFAGSLAGALGVDDFLLLTDVDGVMRDVRDPGSLIKEIAADDIEAMIAAGKIRGGMIPKLEACLIALKNGARKARIINGTKPEQITAVREGVTTGTLITN